MYMQYMRTQLHIIYCVCVDRLFTLSLSPRLLLVVPHVLNPATLKNWVWPGGRG